MKKTLILVLFALLQIACIQTIYAQSLPRVVTVTWDANPPSENVTSYDVVLDTGAAIPVVPSASPSAQVSVATAGHHVVAVIAKSMTLACDDPTQCNTISVTSSAPATVGFTVSAGASPVKNTKIK
jgi:hypothetical protein